MHVAIYVIKKANEAIAKIIPLTITYCNRYVVMALLETSLVTIYFIFLFFIYYLIFPNLRIYVILQFTFTYCITYLHLLYCIMNHFGLVSFLWNGRDLMPLQYTRVALWMMLPITDQ